MKKEDDAIQEIKYLNSDPIIEKKNHSIQLDSISSFTFNCVYESMKCSFS